MSLVEQLRTSDEHMRHAFDGIVAASFSVGDGEANPLDREDRVNSARIKEVLGEKGLQFIDGHLMSSAR